jgi:hypothetical protein
MPYSRQPEQILHRNEKYILECETILFGNCYWHLTEAHCFCLQCSQRETSWWQNWLHWLGQTTAVVCQQEQWYCGEDGVMRRDYQRQRALNEAVGGRSSWKNAGERTAHTSRLQRLKITLTQLIKVWQQTAWAYRVWQKAIMQLSVHPHGDMHSILSESEKLQPSITCSKKRPPTLIMLLRWCSILTPHLMIISTQHHIPEECNVWQQCCKTSKHRTFT